IRASMYLLALINTNLGQGGVAWYVHRRAATPFLEALSSILFIALMQIYQLFLFSTLGVLLYHPASPLQQRIVHVLRVVSAVGWMTLAIWIGFYGLARRSGRIPTWIDASPVRAIARTFVQARPADYAIVLAIKAPSFLGSLIVQ